jgi:hypothetical protein
MIGPACTGSTIASEHWGGGRVLCRGRGVRLATKIAFLREWDDPKGSGHGGGRGCSGACPARQEPIRFMASRQRGQRGVQGAGDTTGGGSWRVGWAGGCHVCFSAGVSSGFWRSNARTRLARTLAAGCNQPKVRTRAKPRGKVCWRKRLMNSRGSSLREENLRVLLWR